jgi:methylmalonyl-CoA/ethylmalonyl-CoA epimerase
MTHDTPIRVDHVGIAVESVADAEPLLRALGCERILADEVDDTFRWVYYALGDASRIELIEPIADDSFLTAFLDRHGPGLHHVTLEVGDIDAVVAAIEATGVDVVDYVERGEWTEAFVSPRTATGTIFQLMEYHDAYVRARDHPPTELFVNGHRVDDPR